VNARIGSFLGLGAVVLALAACGGGGSVNNPSIPPVGGGSTTAPTAPTSQPSAPVTGNTTAPTVSSSPAASVTDATEGHEAQLGMSLLSGFGTVVGPGSIAAMLTNLPGAQPLSTRRTTMGASRTESVSCKNSQTLTTSQNAEGQTTYVLQSFYDTACTHLEYEFDASLATSGGGSVVSGSGHQAFYLDKNGSGSPTAIAQALVSEIYISGYNTSNPTVLVSGTAQAPLTSSVESALAFGAKCVDSTTGKSAGVTCGNGTVLNSASANAALGVVLTPTFANGVFTGLVDDHPVVMTGALNSLTLSPPGQAPDYYTISGGASDSSVTFKVSGSSFTVTDTVASTNYTETISFTSAGLSGTIAAGGKTVATFTTDNYGMGSITYSTGDKGTIADFLVI
jgi:hypothetical protein